MLWGHQLCMSVSLTKRTMRGKESWSMTQKRSVKGEISVMQCWAVQVYLSQLTLIWLLLLPSLSPSLLQVRSTTSITCFEEGKICLMKKRLLLLLLSESKISLFFKSLAVQAVESGWLIADGVWKRRPLNNTSTFITGRLKWAAQSNINTFLSRCQRTSRHTELELLSVYLQKEA